MMTGPAKRAEARVLRRKQPHKEENTRPSRKLVQGRSNMAKCEPLTHSSQGADWKCDQTPLLGKNRRTRNLSNSARRCEHRATPSKFFQRDYSFRHERPHFILKCAVDRTRLSRGVLQMQQSSGQNTLRKSAIQRLHVEKCGAPTNRGPQFVCPHARAQGRVGPENGRDGIARWGG